MCKVTLEKKKIEDLRKNKEKLKKLLMIQQKDVKNTQKRRKIKKKN